MGLITGKHIPRRTFLRSLGATVALPFAGRDGARPESVGRDGVRSIAGPRTPPGAAIEMVHGAAGSSKWGSNPKLLVTS